MPAESHGNIVNIVACRSVQKITDRRIVKSKSQSHCQIVEWLCMQTKCIIWQQTFMLPYLIAHSSVTKLLLFKLVSSTSLPSVPAELAALELATVTVEHFRSSIKRILWRLIGISSANIDSDSFLTVLPSISLPISWKTQQMFYLPCQTNWHNKLHKTLKTANYSMSLTPSNRHN